MIGSIVNQLLVKELFLRQDKRQRKRYYKCECLGCGAEVIARKHDVESGKASACISCSSIKMLPDERFWKDLYRRCFKRSTEKGLAFDLTMDQFKSLSSQDCTYCGTKPRLNTSVRDTAIRVASKRGHRTNSPQIMNLAVPSNGLDRVNNAAGYILSNVKPCCTLCNSMKHIQTDLDFLAQAKKIAAHQEQINHQ